MTGLSNAYSVIIKALALHAAIAGPLLAQRVLDRGTLAFSRSGLVVGKEDFIVQEGRTGGEPGFAILSRVAFPDQPGTGLLPSLELGTDSLPEAYQVIEPPPGPKVSIEVVPRRITVRTERGARESVREYPVRAPVLLVDDSAFALHAFPPPGHPGPVVLLWRSGRREHSQWFDKGIEPTELNGMTVRLHHIQLAGPPLRDLWYDEKGRLAKVDIPSLNVSAVRAP